MRLEPDEYVERRCMPCVPIVLDREDMRRIGLGETLSASVPVQHVSDGSISPAVAVEVSVGEAPR